MDILKEKINKGRKILAEKVGATNPNALPRLEKIVVSSGVGKLKDEKRLKLVADRLARITGQKATSRGAKKSIAAFKSREGDVVGYAVTLRGERMYGFLNKLINVALPRTRDFRGFAKTSVDEMGNLTIGLPEHTIFPETSDEELKDVFGLAITIGTTAQTREQALALFDLIGFPFKK